MTTTAKRRPRKGLISQELLPDRLPAIGHIKIGGLGQKRTSSRGNEFQPPVKYDHFRVTTRTRGEDGNFELDRDVHAVIGEKPTTLDVRLPFDTITENLFAEMTEYAGRSKKVRECDGQTCYLINTAQSVTCSRVRGEDCPCKPYGRLAVMVEAAPTLGGVYVYRTTSWETVAGLTSSLRMFEEQFGSLRGLPLRMVMYEREVTYDGGTGTAWAVALVLRASHDEVRAAALAYHEANQLVASKIRLLSAGVSEDLAQMDAAEAPQIGAEFFAETERAEAARTGLAGINEVIVAETDPADEDDEESAAQSEEAAKIDALVARVTVLLATPGFRASEAQAARFKEIVEERDAEALSQSIEWLEGRLAGPATAAEVATLQELRKVARGIGEGLTLDQEGELDEAVELKEGPAVRAWIARLTEMGAAQGELLTEEG